MQAGVMVHHNEGAAALGGLVVLVCVLAIVIPLVVLAIVCWWRIFSRAGYSGALGLLMLVPFGELIMLLILGFGKWPVLKELDHLKQFHSPPRQG